MLRKPLGLPATPLNPLILGAPEAEDTVLDGLPPRGLPTLCEEVGLTNNPHFLRICLG